MDGMNGNECFPDPFESGEWGGEEVLTSCGWMAADGMEPRLEDDEKQEVDASSRR